MPDKVFTLQGAQKWFLSHPYGSVDCHSRKYHKICKSYFEAYEFYIGIGKEKNDKIIPKIIKEG